MSNRCPTCGHVIGCFPNTELRKREQPAAQVGVMDAKSDHADLIKRLRSQANLDRVMHEPFHARLVDEAAMALLIVDQAAALSTAPKAADLREFRELAEKWLKGGCSSPIGPLHTAGMNIGYECASKELTAAIERQEKGK